MKEQAGYLKAISPARLRTERSTCCETGGRGSRCGWAKGPLGVLEALAAGFNWTPAHSQRARVVVRSEPTASVESLRILVASALPGEAAVAEFSERFELSSGERKLADQAVRFCRDAPKSDDVARAALGPTSSTGEWWRRWRRWPSLA